MIVHQFYKSAQRVWQTRIQKINIGLSALSTISFSNFVLSSVNSFDAKLNSELFNPLSKRFLKVPPFQNIRMLVQCSSFQFFTIRQLIYIVVLATVIYSFIFQSLISIVIIVSFLTSMACSFICS